VAKTWFSTTKTYRQGNNRYYYPYPQQNKYVGTGSRHSHQYYNPNNFRSGYVGSNARRNRR
jgi:hypothetical protein